jgi:hypothetical protein
MWSHRIKAPLRYPAEGTLKKPSFLRYPGVTLNKVPWRYLDARVPWRYLDARVPWRYLDARVPWRNLFTKYPRGTFKIKVP